MKRRSADAKFATYHIGENRFRFKFRLHVTKTYMFPISEVMRNKAVEYQNPITIREKLSLDAIFNNINHCFLIWNFLINLICLIFCLTSAVYLKLGVAGEV